VVGGQPADGGDGLCPLAFLACSVRVRTVTAVQQLVLVPVQKSPGVVLIPQHGIQPRAGGKVPVHVFIVAQQLVCPAAGGHLGFGVKYGLVRMVFVDIGPPGLGMAYKVDLGVFFQHLVKTFEAIVVHAVLPVHQDGHIIFLGQLVELLHFRGVRFHAEFGFGDHFGAQLQVFFDFAGGLQPVGHLIRRKQKLIGIFLGEFISDPVAAGLGLQAVGFAAVCGGGVHGAARRQQYGGGDAHGPLVGQQLCIVPPVVV